VTRSLYDILGNLEQSNEDSIAALDEAFGDDPIDFEQGLNILLTTCVGGKIMDALEREIQ
jgi:hypothetical protein